MHSTRYGRQRFSQTTYDMTATEAVYTRLSFGGLRASTIEMGYSFNLLRRLSDWEYSYPEGIVYACALQSGGFGNGLLLSNILLTR